MSTARPSSNTTTITSLPLTDQLVSTTTEEPENADEPWEDYHSGLIAISVLILFSNVFAIQIYIRQEKIRRNFSNVLLLSLAISDLFAGVIVLSFMIFCEIESDQLVSKHKPLYYACRINFLLINFFGFSTIFHIIALTVEKYIAVLHPFQKLNVSTRGYYRKIIISVWLMALCFALIPLFWIFKDPRSEAWREKFHNFGILQIIVFFGFSVIVLTYCYCRMFFQIHAKLSERARTGRVQIRVRSDRKTIIVFLLFYVIFIIGWFPWFFFTLDRNKLNIVSDEVKDFLITLRFLGAFLNPLLYAFLKNDYKQAVCLDFDGFCASCPKRLRFHKLVNQQGGTLRNNNGEHGTTGTAGVRLEKIEILRSKQRPSAASVTSGSGAQCVSQTMDTNL